jgi:hypothetical protein
MPRLTDDEIYRAVGRIRSEYDHYIVHFHKTAEAKKKFEERWTDALRARIDLTTFLGAEISVVRSLIDKAKQDAAGPPPPPKPVKKRQSYAERIIEQLRAKIKEYPSLGLPEHPEMSPDVDKLYGTLRWFRKEVWDVLYPTLLSKAPSPALFIADTDLGAMTLQGDRWPKEVDAYVSLYKSRLDLSQVARAQNRCLLMGAQLLQKLKRLFETAAQQETLNEQERLGVKRALAFCDRVLNDFRLKELAART